MRYLTRVAVMCDGCGALAQTQRDVAVTSTGEHGLLRHPDGWGARQVEPGVALVGVARPDPNPHGNPADYATAIGKPMPILLCPACLAHHNDPAS